jgi:hypothetical protein
VGTVEGFDPLTGKTTWSVPMGAARSLAYDERPATAGTTKVAVELSSGLVILDYLTGATESPTPNAGYWCVADASYTATDAWEKRQRYPRPGGMLAFICDGRGHAAAVLPSAAATMAAGAQIGSYAVIATHEGMFGFEAL